MFKKILIILLLVGLAILAFLYFGTFSEGTRAGVVLKISKRGTVVKTWEGQMDTETFGAVNDPKNIVSETFTFSVEKGNPELIQALEDAALSGERVNLKYKERFIKVFWRGDTKVFVTKVERAGASSKKKKDNMLRR
jgi:hypothetical protein